VKTILLVTSLVAPVMLGACRTAAYDYSKEPDPRRTEFVVGVADTLKVTVWKNSDLSTEAKVRPDGTITLPLIGDLQAAGRTPAQLRAEITSKLSAFVKEDAVVTIAITEVNSYRFTVSGNVEHAGVIAAKYYVTVAEAIALAGGLNKFASQHKLVVVRTDANGLRRIPIDYDRIASGDHPEENLVLLSGDTLFAP
jgi:polysaccharide export outer membrane protein